MNLHLNTPSDVLDSLHPDLMVIRVAGLNLYNPNDRPIIMKLKLRKTVLTTGVITKDGENTLHEFKLNYHSQLFDSLKVQLTPCFLILIVLSL